MSVADFDQTQYSIHGHQCFSCGYPKMAVIRSNVMVKDSFVPGFQRNIRKHCATYAEYKQHLKNMGLIEIGYEDLPETEDKTKYWTPELLKKLYDMGLGFGDCELDAIEAGKIDGLY